jgi:putative Holliday junction resolvase
MGTLGREPGRVLGIDVGGRRVGLAISDRSRTLARPLSTLTVRHADDAVTQVAQMIAQLAQEEDGLREIVVGLPVRLDGTPSEQTPRVGLFMAKLGARTSLPIVAGDERLTSVEAESRLAIRDGDWRRRKLKLDAAAAAIMLQDYLDRSGRDM